MTKETYTANDARKIQAHNLVNKFGADFLNPLIGASPAKTCAKVEPVIELLHELFDRNLVSEDMNPGLAAIVQTVLSAMQYEMWGR